MTTKPLPTTQDNATKSPTPQPDRVVQPARTPAVTIRENETSIVVIADMPGVTHDRVEISVNNDVLTVHGSVPDDKHDGYHLLHREYEAIRFERSFTIPDEIEKQQVTAAVKNGVVTITLPKKQSQQPHRISVSAG